jgi:hypothetical protein
MTHSGCRALGLVGIGLCLPLLLSGSPGRGQPAANEVTVKVVKYDELADIVRKLRGQVVVVDFWAND